MTKLGRKTWWLGGTTWEGTVLGSEDIIVRCAVPGHPDRTWRHGAIREAEIQRDRILGLYRDRGAAVTVSIEFSTGAVLTQTLEARLSRTAASQAAPAPPASGRQAGRGTDGGGEDERPALQVLKAVAMMAVIAVVAVMAAASMDGDGGKGDGYAPRPGSSGWVDGTGAPGSLLDPKDDLDGDGWVDDPCPDKNTPLSAEC
ncbi:hypothetical protein [Streptomyces sp. NBC_01294]|uniref:hypothetical protein n=1 Tax=Streptomyces sp. NBC_01294 TaxID=2903815 RepID=UPI002DDBD943|nr:hypothetical protein [Streptomyces sp. NBC_01294]WRZ62313.1 hypothetical protein OG534_38290 [Streptomyces sp. NBC_01294]